MLPSRSELIHAAQRIGAQLPARAATEVVRSAKVRRQTLPRFIGTRPLTVSCNTLVGGRRSMVESMFNRSALVTRSEQPREPRRPKAKGSREALLAGAWLLLAKLDR